MARVGSVKIKISSVASMDHSADGAPQEIPRLKRGQRLYIVSGPDWQAGLDDIYSEEPPEPVWLMDGACRKGDLLLTILGTRPRVVFCLEVVRSDAADDNVIEVCSPIDFENGLSLNAILDRLGFTIRGGEYYSGAKGNAILDAVREEYANPSPWFTAPRRSSIDVETLQAH